MVFRQFYDWAYVRLGQVTVVTALLSLPPSIITQRVHGMTYVALVLCAIMWATLIYLPSPTTKSTSTVPTLGKKQTDHQQTCHCENCDGHTQPNN